MDFGGWDVLTTLLIALYGAVLSTFTIISQKKEHKREVKVTLSFGFVDQGRPLEAMFILSAKNTGSKTVTMSSRGLILPNNKILHFVRQSYFPFPIELTEGKDIFDWREVKELAQELKKEGYSGIIEVKGFFKDAVDHWYESKLVKFDLEEWTK
ncbi:MAG: hypothetical protein ACBZ72_01195 [Candidatus Bathyarchaeia archaeon]